MASAVMILDYRSTTKPFVLVQRTHDLGGTDYEPICRLSIDHAKLLASEGIKWLYGEPSWLQVYKKLEILETEAQQKALSDKLATLKADVGPTL